MEGGRGGGVTTSTGCLRFTLYITSPTRKGVESFRQPKTWITKVHKPQPRITKVHENA